MTVHRLTATSLVRGAVDARRRLRGSHKFAASLYLSLRLSLRGSRLPHQREARGGCVFSGELRFATRTSFGTSIPRRRHRGGRLYPRRQMKPCGAGDVEDAVPYKGGLEFVRHCISLRRRISTSVCRCAAAAPLIRGRRGVVVCSAVNCDWQRAPHSARPHRAAVTVGGRLCTPEANETVRRRGRRGRYDKV